MCGSQMDDVEGVDQVDVDDVVEIFQWYWVVIFVDYVFGIVDVGVVDEDVWCVVGFLCGIEGCCY